MTQVRIYTTLTCSYCWAAKRLLDSLDVAFTEIDVSADSATRQWLVETTGLRTVPQIFVGDTSIGGYTELLALKKSGRLDEMLGRAR